ncbi:MBL fold metallo-hydrolase [Bacillus sp. 2205SS5-2]|uniref:MBL fold metallo-hydrolase n=1 Tax=Bacillus sp. 2205SS5-2 TaxID=3109031 RepID=UPI003004BD7F
MFFRSFFDENLAQYSYLVGCQRTGEAIVIDPARDTSLYQETATNEGFNLVAAAETHIHADFVSGARQMAEDYGTLLYLSDEGDENWKYRYLDEVKHELVRDESVFYIGNIEFKVFHTPGHTPESISFLLTDKGGGSSVPMGIFTGDFVFVGDVGRPDLLEKAAGVKGTADIGAKDMFHSVKKFKELPDYVMVWPGHGAGSACGKSLGAVPFSTVGYEKKNNWAFLMNDEESFIAELLKDQPEPPTYFAMMKKVNKEGPALLTREVKATIYDKNDLENLLQKEKTVLIDSRSQSEFSTSHIEGSINIPYNKGFANWAGWLFEYDENLVILAAEDHRDELQLALESIGLDRIVSYVAPEVLGQYESTLEQYEYIEADQLVAQYEDDSTYVIDIRKQSEWNEGHLPTAHHHLLGNLRKQGDRIPRNKKLIVHCQSGTRSAIGTSVLQAMGYKNIHNYSGGFSDWKNKNHPIDMKDPSQKRN